MRLIDADAIIELAQKTHCTGCDNYNGVRCRACRINDMIEAIDDAPTVDKWYYLSKGEYPPKNKQLEEDGKVLCFFNSGSRDVAWYIKTKDQEGWLTFCGLEPVQSVKCWQFIYPPKEEE